MPQRLQLYHVEYAVILWQRQASSKQREEYPHEMPTGGKRQYSIKAQALQLFGTRLTPSTSIGDSLYALITLLFGVSCFFNGTCGDLQELRLSIASSNFHPYMRAGVEVLRIIPRANADETLYSVEKAEKDN
jgi:hypothetical protein